MDMRFVLQQAEKITAELWEDLIRFRRDMHAHPELSMQERRTSQLVKDFLAAHGVESRSISDDKGVYLLIEGAEPGETVMIRADLDALPVEEETDLPFSSRCEGIMHACGHDMNTTMLLGAVICLTRMRHLVKGKILCLFQCGEETFQGAKQVIDAGIMNGLSPRFQFAFHGNPGFDVGTIALRRGNALSAGAELDIVIKGKGGHGGFPQQTNDPISIAAQIVTGLQTLAARRHHPADPLVITIGSLHGGHARNVTPNEVHMQGIVRYFNEELGQKLPQIISDFCIHTAEAYGAQCDVQYRLACPPLNTADEIFCYADAVLGEAFGHDHVVHMQQPMMGSEDFAYFSPYGQVMQIRIGTRFADPRSQNALHTSKIVFSEDAIAVGIKAATALALNINEYTPKTDQEV